MLKHTAWTRTVLEECCTVFLRGKRNPDGILRHSDGTVANQTVKSKSRNMQHILTPQANLPLVRKIRILLRASRVGVVEFSRAAVATDLHLVREQRIETKDTPPAIPQNLCIRIPPQKEVTHQCFAKYKGSHLGIRRIVEQEVQRMLRHTLFALFFVDVDVKRQPCDGLREDTDTGIDCRCLHCSTLIDRLARRRLPKQKRQAADMISGLVSRTEDFCKEIHEHHAPFVNWRIIQ